MSRRLPRWIFCGLVCLFWLTAGCNSSESTKAPAKSEVASPVTVKPAGRADLDALIAQHKGRVVLVDYWATWCGACRKKFPHTVKLAKELKSSGLSVITVAMDDEDAREEAVKFLTEQQASFDNLIAKDGTSDESFDSFEIPDRTLPCLRLFDREGKVVQTFAIDVNADKQFTDEDVAVAVRQQLAASAQ